MLDTLPAVPTGDKTPVSFAPLDSSDNLNSARFGNMDIDRGMIRPMIRPMIADNGRRIEWASSLADGVRQAQAEGKPLVCVFEEDQCGWCKRLDQELSKPAANAVGGDAVFVKVRPSADPDGQMLANNLGINAYPTVSIIDVNNSSFNERKRLTGYMSAETFAAAFQPQPGISASVLV